MKKKYSNVFSGCFYLLGVCLLFNPAAKVSAEPSDVPALMADVRVKGKVTSSTGAPLPGVNILVKGTNIGTTTDFDGNYSIDVPSNTDSISFSYIGFLTKTLTVGSQAQLDVALDEDTKSLGEVVVVGYGTQTKANLTGAVSTVQIDKVMKSRPVTDVARSLQGAVPGLTIRTTSGDLGRNPTIRLRGLVGSLNAGSGASPLILVDNVEIQNLQMVNPDDIESISVLKDAASTSIYGSRGAWGVILITTKSGTKNSKGQIIYSNNFSFSTPTVTPKIADAADGPTYTLAATRRTNPAATVFGTVGMFFDDQSIEKIRAWQQTYGNQNLGPEMEMGRDFEIIDERLFFYRPWDAEEMYMRKWAPQQNHNLLFSGGGERTSYNVSLGYMGQQGILKDKTDLFKRYSGTVTIKSSVKDWLEITGRVMMTQLVSETPFSFGGTTYDPLYYIYRWHRVYPYGTYEGRPFRSAVTEVQQAQMVRQNSGLVRTMIGGVANILPGLTFTANYTFSTTNTRTRQVGGSVEAWNQWNGVPLRYETFTSASYNRVNYNSLWNYWHTVKAFATYNKALENHSFKAILGSDLDLSFSGSQASERRNLLDPTLGELSLATGDQYVDGSRSHWATKGFFGRINYSYKEKLLLEVNGRYDGSSFFPSSSQWAFFPSVSAGYLLTEEAFMDPLKPLLNSFKIRGSWGSLGNTDVGGTTFRPLMNTYASNWWIGNINNVTAGTPLPIPSRLTWEKISTLDFGFDAGLFNDRLGVTFDWYQRTTDNMITPGVLLPSTFGTTPPRRNYGSMQTTGYEITVDYAETFSNGLNLNATLIFSDFIEKITKFDGNIVTGNYAGKTLGEIWGYETDRFFTKDDFVTGSDGELATNDDGKYILQDGVPSQARFEEGWFFYGPGDVKYKDLNGDGEIFNGTNSLEDHGDLKVIGNSSPRYQYGVRLGANWKSIDFNIFFQGVGKRDIWASGMAFIPGFNPLDAMYQHQMDYWTEENPNAFYPRPTNTGQSNNTQNFLIQSKYLLDMSYTRLKNVSLGYTLPSQWMQKLKIETLRIYVNGENLFTRSDVGIPIDPEVDFLTTSSPPETFGRVYPYRRTISAGLQLTF